MAEYMVERYHRRRAMIIENLGGECAHCSSTEQLEIDHIDRSTKSFDIGKAISGWAEERIQRELDKCQLLCKDCHLEKTEAETVSGHGVGVSGAKNCYCTECAPLKKEYMKKYYEDKPRNYCECGEEIDRRGRSKRCRSCNNKNSTKK